MKEQASFLIQDIVHTDYNEFYAQDSLLSLNNIRAELLQTGQELFDFSMINPDLAPAREIVDKLVQASLKSYHHRYGVSRGIKKLREGFSEKYKRIFDVVIDPATNVCVTQGCKDAVLQLLRVICKPKDTVLIINPTYPAYLYAINYLNLETVRVSLEENEEDTLQGIKAALKGNRIKAILLNFPHNPSGQLVTKKFWSDLYSLTTERNITIINDFTYGEMLYSNKPGTSLLHSSEDSKGVIPKFHNLIEIYSISKSYSVPGWRIAAIVGDTEIVKQVSQLKSKIDYGIFLPIQIAAAHALSIDSIPHDITDIYKHRAKVLAESLSSLGWRAQLPLAGASLWVKIPDKLLSAFNNSTSSGYAISEQLLSKASVYALPGEYFGLNLKEYMRFALVLPVDKIRAAINKMSKVTQENI